MPFILEKFMFILAFSIAKKKKVCYGKGNPKVWVIYFIYQILSESSRKNQNLLIVIRAGFGKIPCIHFKMRLVLGGNGVSFIQTGKKKTRRDRLAKKKI